MLAFALAPLVLALPPGCSSLRCSSCPVSGCSRCWCSDWPSCSAGRTADQAAVVLAVVWLSALAVGLLSVLALLGRGVE